MRNTMSTFHPRPSPDNAVRPLPRLKVLLADDHAILRSGLKRIIEELPEVAAVGEAANGDEIMQKVRAEHWDVLILDLDMPGHDPLDVLKLIKIDFPALGILILSMYAEEQFGLRALKAGAAGYVNKKDAPEQLVMAIRRVGEGGAYISANLAATLAQGLREGRLDVDFNSLSDREFIVLRGIAAGHSIAELAADLKISVKTVSTYRARLLTKLNLSSNVEIARYAIDHGLIK